MVKNLTGNTYFQFFKAVVKTVEIKTKQNLKRIQRMFKACFRNYFSPAVCLAKEVSKSNLRMLSL